MIGLIARLRSVGRRREPDVVDGDGVVWVEGNRCRTCGEPVDDVETAPTAVDRTDLIANCAAGENGEPRSVFCSNRCRDDFREVFER